MTRLFLSLVLFFNHQRTHAQGARTADEQRPKDERSYKTRQHVIPSQVMRGDAMATPHD